mgnify:CR=1 FL=1
MADTHMLLILHMVPRVDESENIIFSLHRAMDMVQTMVIHLWSFKHTHILYTPGPTIFHGSKNRHIMVPYIVRI